MFRGQPLEAGTTSQQPAFSCTALAAHLVYSGHGSAPFKGSMKLNKSPVPYSLHHQLCKGSPSKKVYRSLVDQFSKMLQPPVSRSIDTSPPVSVLRTLFNLQHQDASQRKIEITISAPQPPAPEARSTLANKTLMLISWRPVGQTLESRAAARCPLPPFIACFSRVRPAAANRGNRRSVRSSRYKDLPMLQFLWLGKTLFE
jgi:hypothetical protein